MKFKISIFLFFISISTIVYPNTDPEITIFVHGTFGIKETFCLSTFFKLWKDEIDNSEYQNKIKKLRKEPFYFNLQPIDHVGLIPIKCGKDYKGAEIFTDIYHNIYKKYHKTSCKCYYYTYGWSGLLSAKSRLQESFDFYKVLKKEIERFEHKHKKKPKIRLIGHSHGGNLCLNLAFARKENPKDKFKIDELILIGMPVQRCTAELIQDKLFKKIYHIFSTGDYVQRLDIFTPYNFFSKKRFKDKDYCKLPDNLTQIELMLTVPTKATPKTTANKSPGHVELWFFGWTPTMYRKKHPFYPLPTGVFIPYFTHICDTHMADEKYVKCLIKPELEVMHLKGKNTKLKKVVPFVCQKDIQKFKSHALKKYGGRKKVKKPE